MHDTDAKFSASIKAADLQIEERHGGLDEVARFRLSTEPGAPVFKIGRGYVEPLHFFIQERDRVSAPNDPVWLSYNSNSKASEKGDRYLRFTISSLMGKSLLVARLIMDAKRGQVVRLSKEDRHDYRVASLRIVRGPAKEDTRGLLYSILRDALVKARKDPYPVIERLRGMFAAADVHHGLDQTAISVEVPHTEDRQRPEAERQAEQTAADLLAEYGAKANAA